MNAKRIIAPDMRRALKLVREKLGVNAVILQNKTTPEGVELIATNEEVGAVFSSLKHSAPLGAEPARAALADGNVLTDASSVQVQRTVAQSPGGGHASSEEGGKRNAPANQLEAGIRQRLMGHKGATQDKMSAQASDANPSTRVEQLEANAVDEMGASGREHLTDFGRLLGTLTDAETVRYPQTSRGATNKSGVLPAEQVAQIRDSVAQNYTVVIDTLKEEVDLLRRLLTTQSAEQRWEHLSYTQPLKAHLLQQLIGAGYLPNLSRSWVEALDNPTDLKSAWKALLKKIFAVLPVAPEGIFKQNEAVALVGPTGAGKTSTIGKLAAAFVLNGKAQELAIISTDAYRIGAQDQLRMLCQILSVPLTIVDDHMSLRRALARHAGRRKVLVDTAGLTLRDPAWQLQLKELQSCRQSVANYMVMSTTHQLAVHVKAFQDYASLPLTGCILTKLDECGRLGDSLSAVIQANLPIACTTTGMRIPEDLASVHPLQLIKQSLADSVGDCLDPVLAQSCFQSLDSVEQKPGKDVESLLDVCGL